MGRFTDKVVIVTGGAGGIGSVVSKSFAAEGAHLVVADANLEASDRTVNEITKAGGKSISQKLNVLSWKDVQAMIERTIGTYGKLDVIANCVGIAVMRKLEEITEEVWDNTMDVNARGTFFCGKAAGLQMKKQGMGGKIVNIASEAGKIGAPFYTHYCASKFAVIGITKSLALEFAESEINVNAVCPGSIDTGMLKYELETYAQLKGKAVSEIYTEWTGCPLGRVGKPQDVARVILFLASEDADFMTGQAVNITGGRTTF